MGIRWNKRKKNFFYKDGDKYEGYFFNGKKIRFVIMKFSNEDKYKGDWVEY